MKTLHPRCAGVDVRKLEVVACLRLVNKGKTAHEVRRFPTTTTRLCELSEWLEQVRCTHVVMEATGVNWKPVWHILDTGECCACEERAWPQERLGSAIFWRTA